MFQVFVSALLVSHTLIFSVIVFFLLIIFIESSQLNKCPRFLIKGLGKLSNRVYPTGDRFKNCPSPQDKHR
jgi:hypothetical protein